MMVSHAPRLAPTVIRRLRLEDWFLRAAKVPVRFVVGPPGSGKTTALLGYLRSTESAAMYCSLKEGASAADVRAAIAIAMQWNADRVSHDDIIRGLEELAPIALALDHMDAADPSGIDEILQLIEAVPEEVSLLIACRSRNVIDVRGLVARGMAALCDPERLLFDSTEVRDLAKACNVSFSDSDVARLLEATDGWPIAVSSAIRKAAEDEITLTEAFERWRSRQGHIFAEFVIAALEKAQEEDGELVRSLMAGTPCNDEERLSILETQGLFVVRSERGFRPFGALSRLRSCNVADATHGVTPMHVRLFGGFQVEIDGHEVKWIRRRDAQVFKFIALKPDGKVNRAELADKFWPGAERHLVAQSVRNVCCNIRKAIARVVGYDMVDHYFRVNGDIWIDFDNVVVDVERFLAHVNDGDREYLRNDLQAASAHYQMADKLYSAHLLPIDPAEQWFAAQVSGLEDRQVTVLERLSRIAHELEDVGTAVTYARRVLGTRPESEAARGVLMMAFRRVGLRNLARIEANEAASA